MNKRAGTKWLTSLVQSLTHTNIYVLTHNIHDDDDFVKTRIYTKPHNKLNAL